MKRLLLIFFLLLLPVVACFSQEFTNSAAVVSSGGGLSNNSIYQQFGVLGESLVNTYVSNNVNNGTLGFIFQDDGIAFAPPLKTILLFPQNNSILSNDPAKPITITFYWIQQNDVNFKFLLARDNNFTNMIADTTLNNNYLAIVLPLNGELFWKVQCVKGQYIADWSDTWSFKLLLTDVSEVNAQSLVSIYPNPAQDLSNIIVGETLLGGDIFIYDLLGNLRFHASNIGSVSSVGLSDIESGTYFARIIKGAIIVHQKLIKE